MTPPRASAEERAKLIARKLLYVHPSHEKFIADQIQQACEEAREELKNELGPYLNLKREGDYQEGYAQGFADGIERAAKLVEEVQGLGCIQAENIRSLKAGDK